MLPHVDDKQSFWWNPKIGLKFLRAITKRSIYSHQMPVQSQQYLPTNHIAKFKVQYKMTSPFRFVFRKEVIWVVNAQITNWKWMKGQSRTYRQVQSSSFVGSKLPEMTLWSIHTYIHTFHPWISESHSRHHLFSYRLPGCISVSLRDSIKLQATHKCHH